MTTSKMARPAIISPTRHDPHVAALTEALDAAAQAYLVIAQSTEHDIYRVARSVNAAQQLQRKALAIRNTGFI